jgi:hypothetical protein
MILRNGGCPGRRCSETDIKIIQAPKGRNRTAQGGGREAAGALGLKKENDSPERAAQYGGICFAPSGLTAYGSKQRCKVWLARTRQNRNRTAG